MKNFSNPSILKESKLLGNYIPVLFVVSAFSLIWRYGIVPGVQFSKPFEILILVTAGATALGVINNKEYASALRRVASRYSLVLGILAFSTLVGLVYSLFVLQESHQYLSSVYSELGRLFIAVLTFFVAAHVVCVNPKSLKWTLSAVVASPVVLYLAFLPKLQEFFIRDARLVGAKNDPNYLATFLALGLIIASVFFLFNKGRRRWLGIVYIFAASPLFLWANSRAALVSIFAALAAMSVLYFLRNRSRRAALSIIILAISFVAAMSVSFFVLPGDSQFWIYSKSASYFLPDDALLSYAEPVYDFDITRGRLWREGFLKTIGLPLGLGPAYHNWAPIASMYGPHNLWLEVSLTSGWIGLGALIALLVMIFKDSRLRDIESWADNAIFIGLIYLLINGFFLDMLTLRWLWLLMGMVVGRAIYFKDNRYA